uniref:Actin-modulator n=1 Tax=Crassostrea virginica TaxID=6565 RepID=A0A8B8B9N0_CRAVI|nr:gelsolin-like protein 2 [Crassostrea virginica]XP_022299452.1 gelsolin-like protein 2 [Crassostrea virginica]XP_022299453.1 gelsolin-like protein 2 [Crassostrea virginica]XP_022299454.1 gelsolin-like protein 2 [Crassostrea virginica]XP_022299455.1 gelsolin-like protein 2 [Crassostrea virginica]
MAGLIKAKKYDWKDSNMALFGSDTERQVKKESAMTEPAWEGAGTEVGLKIWRIVKFEVTDWPVEDYGKFFTGDSYIILKTYKEGDSEDLKYDLHFWIGTQSTQDEYGTAAYKTVELDTFLDDKAVQHREVQGHESEKFKSYFSTIQYLEGGAETGFRHVEPVEYKPRLLQFNGKGRHVTVKEVPFTEKSLKSDDVFVLDKGLEIIQWNGAGSNGMEKIKAQQFCQQLEAERSGASNSVVEEGSRAAAFYDGLPDDDVEAEEDEGVTTGESILMKVSDASGKIEMTEVKKGSVTRDDLSSDDVFLVDTGLQVFVYVGGNASPQEKKNGFPYAHKYIQENDKKPFIHVTVVKEGQDSELETLLQ